MGIGRLRKRTAEGLIDNLGRTAALRRTAFEATGNGDETTVLRAVLNELITLNDTMDAIAERLDLMNKTLSLIHDKE